MISLGRTVYVLREHVRITCPFCLWVSGAPPMDQKRAITAAGEDRSEQMYIHRRVIEAAREAVRELDQHLTRVHFIPY